MASWAHVPSARSFLQRQFIPTTVLIVSLVMSAIAVVVVGVAGMSRDRAHFETEVRAIQDLILGRVQTYVAMLVSTRGLFDAAAVQHVAITQVAYRAYISQLDLTHDYPGIQGIGYARVIPKRALADAIAQIRAEGQPSFLLWPQLGQSVYTPIVYLEPDDSRHRVAIGFDMQTEPERWAAMERARDSGEVTITSRVTLMQEIDSEKHPGFLIYVPDYRGVGIPPTVHARRATIQGFVYAPFRADDFFRGLLPSGRWPSVRCAVYDGTDVREHHRLAVIGPQWDTRHWWQPARTTTRTIMIVGRPWTLVMTATSGEGNAGLLWPLGVGILSLIVSFGFYLLSQAQRTAQQAAERSEAARGRFFAAMSHELRTPLNAIIGYNDLMLAGIYGPLADAQRNGIERAQRAAFHLRELVSDVLDLSKIESGKTDIDVSPVDVAMVIQELFSTVAPIASAYGVALHHQCDLSLPLQTDPRRLRQILLNLLSNAIKFGGRQAVEVSCAQTPDGGIRVAVRDHGPGILPEDQERIFEEFVQLPSAETHGTGLGLPISRRLARLLGGTLTVESKLGDGATFYLSLPPAPPTSG